MNPDCIFCKMVKGEIPINKIYEDDNFLAFLDINQMTDGHTVLISKKHFDSIWDVKNIGEMVEVAQKLANNFIEKSDVKKVKSFIWQEDVSHAHMHLLPNGTDKLKSTFHEFSMQNSTNLDPDKAKILVEKYRI